MAADKRVPPVEYRFKKGQSGNPGGKPAGILRNDEIKGLLGRMWRFSRKEIDAILKNPASTVGEVMVASIIAKAVDQGDYSRVEFLLNRTIGKVKDQVEVSAKPYILERRDGSQVLLGAESDEDSES